MHRRSTEHGDGKNQFVDAELWVEPAEWERCVDMVHESAILFHDAASPPRTEGTIRVTMSAALFPMCTSESPDPEPLLG